MKTVIVLSLINVHDKININEIIVPIIMIAFVKIRIVENYIKIYLKKLHNTLGQDSQEFQKIQRILIIKNIVEKSDKFNVIRINNRY